VRTLVATPEAAAHLAAVLAVFQPRGGAPVAIRARAKGHKKTDHVAEAPFPAADALALATCVDAAAALLRAPSTANAQRRHLLCVAASRPLLRACSSCLDGAVAEVRAEHASPSTTRGAQGVQRRLHRGFGADLVWHGGDARGRIVAGCALAELFAVHGAAARMEALLQGGVVRALVASFCECGHEARMEQLRRCVPLLASSSTVPTPIARPYICAMRLAMQCPSCFSISVHLSATDTRLQALEAIQCPCDRLCPSKSKSLCHYRALLLSCAKCRQVCAWVSGCQALNNHISHHPSFQRTGPCALTGVLWPLLRALARNGDSAQGSADDGEALATLLRSRLLSGCFAVLLAELRLLVLLQQVSSGRLEWPEAVAGELRSYLASLAARGKRQWEKSKESAVGEESKDGSATEALCLRLLKEMVDASGKCD
jgi:hypothetical protein